MSMKVLLCVVCVLFVSCAKFLLIPGQYRQTGQSYPPLSDQETIRVFELDPPASRHAEIGRFSMGEDIRHRHDSGSPYNRLRCAQARARKVGGNGIIVLKEEYSSRFVMEQVEDSFDRDKKTWKNVEKWRVTQEFIIIRLLSGDAGKTTAATNTAPAE